ncbi:MAG: hypothetical protein WC803_12380 [Sphingomonas sp.]|jgi:hypothetical protein
MIGRRAVLAAGAFAVVPMLGIKSWAAEFETLRSIRQEIANQPKIMLAEAGATIAVAFATGSQGVDRDGVLNWIRRSARAASVYFGRFPVKHVDMLIVGEPGGRVGHATTWGYGGSTIRVHVGVDARTPAFLRDWVMVHEMTHLALPTLPDEQSWALEGNATYVEPIARVQSGDLRAETIWRDMWLGMPNGLPQAGDEGLDRTHSWGRTYWGGALFYLMADIDIRRRTANRRGLQHALRAINRASGGNSAEWPMEQLIATGDKAAGVDALAKLYDSWSNAAVSVDIDGLFAQLGVRKQGDAISFDEGAPLAATRRAITTALAAS